MKWQEQWQFVDDKRRFCSVKGLCREWDVDINTITEEEFEELLELDGFRRAIWIAIWKSKNSADKCA